MASTPTKRGDSWYIKVRRNGVSKSASFPLKSQATAWAAKTEAEILNGKFSGIVDKTFGELLRKYHDEVSIHKRTGRSEQVRIQRLIKDPIASVKLADLTDSHFIEFRDKLLNGYNKRKPILGASVIRYFAIFSPALKLAINEWKWMKSNPLAGVRKPKNSRPRDRRPTTEELKTLCYVMGYEPDKKLTMVKHRVAAAMFFSVETGCRERDLCSIRRDSVDLKQRTANVEWDTKTGFRAIALTTEACRIAKQLMESHDEPTLFNLKASQIESNFRKYKKQALVEGLTFHDMKHEACTRLAKYMSIQDLARNVGTRNLSTLMIYYNPTAAEIAKNLP